MKGDFNQLVKEKALLFHGGLLGYEKMGFIDGAEFGYSLAQQEIKERDEEIKRLKERLSFHTEDTWYDEKYVNELIRTAGNAQDTLIKEIERLSKENTELKAKLNG